VVDDEPDWGHCRAVSNESTAKEASKELAAAEADRAALTEMIDPPVIRSGDLAAWVAKPAGLISPGLSLPSVLDTLPGLHDDVQQP
jgi:hypothetical protein